MKKQEFQRPDEAAMQRVLKNNEWTISGVILRLAWMAGFNVNDMRSLTWQHISFDTAEIIFKDRRIPMDTALQECLQVRYKTLQCHEREPIIVASRTQDVMHRVVISRLARTALDAEEALQHITLTELREDFVIRQLEKHDWGYVAKISGIKRGTILSTYASYIKKENTQRRGTNIKQVEDVQDNEYKLWTLVQTESLSAEGLAVALISQFGMTLDEVIGLTWDQVDFGNKIIHINGRQVTIGAVLERRLRQLYEARRPEEDSHILLTPKSRKPFRRDRLSRIIGEVLVQYGLGDVDLWKLSHMKENQEKKRLILQYTTDYGFITGLEAAEVLKESPGAARLYLKKLTQTGALTQIGTRYYPAERIVPPEKQEEAVINYIKEKGSAQRGALADLLGIEERQCTGVLTRLIEKRTLERVGLKYYLKEEAPITKNSK